MHVLGLQYHFQPGSPGQGILPQDWQVDFTVIPPAPGGCKYLLVSVDTLLDELKHSHAELEEAMKL